MELLPLQFSWSCLYLQQNMEQREEPIAPHALTCLSRTMFSASWAPWSLSLPCDAAGAWSCRAAPLAALRQSVQAVRAAHYTQEKLKYCRRCCPRGNSESHPLHYVGVMCWALTGNSPVKSLSRSETRAVPRFLCLWGL